MTSREASDSLIGSGGRLPLSSLNRPPSPGPRFDTRSRSARQAAPSPTRPRALHDHEQAPTKARIRLAALIPQGPEMTELSDAFAPLGPWKSSFARSLEASQRGKGSRPRRIVARQACVRPSDSPSGSAPRCRLQGAARLCRGRNELISGCFLLRHLS